VFRLRETLLDGSDDSIEAMSKALQLGKGHITSRILLIFLSPNLIRLKTRRNSPRRNRDRKQAGNWKRLAGEPGFEPGLTESESVGLPLTYSPIVPGLIPTRTDWRSIRQVRFGGNPIFSAASAQLSAIIRLLYSRLPLIH
jgi:hypothetical protein